MDQSFTIAVGADAASLAGDMLASNTGFVGGFMDEDAVDAALDAFVTPPTGGGTGTSSGGLGADPVGVPEPAGAGLFGLGVLLVGCAEALCRLHHAVYGALVA